MRSVDQLGGQTGHWSDLVGTKKGQEIHAEQRGRTPDGRTTILKIRYFDIQPNHFSWVADRSEDGGVTWAREYLASRPPATSGRPVKQAGVGAVLVSYWRGLNRRRKGREVSTISGQPAPLPLTATHSDNFRAL